VPAGQQVILLCDSVNLLNATTIAAGAANISLVDGSAGAPSLNFGSETNTGIFRPGSGEFGITVLGVEVLAASNSSGTVGVTVPGFGIFTGGVSGGTF
jgi:hypothetical protein